MLSPDAIYYLILAWIPASAMVFAMTRPVKAFMIVYLIGWLALPAYTIDVPGFWDVGKEMATNIGALIGVLLFVSQRIRHFRPHIADLFLGLFAVATCVTSMLNDLGVYDGISSTSQEFLHYGVPYYLGRIVLRERRDLIEASRYVVAAAGVTGCLALWEWRMSPQIHATLYGGFQHSWQQHERWGFYRPIICFHHALGLAMFMVWTALLAISMHAARLLRGPWGLPPYTWVIATVAGVVASMSLGPWFLFGMGCVAWRLWRRSHKRALLWCMVSFVVLWIGGRYFGVMSGQQLVDATSMLSSERSESLNYRVQVEDELIGRAKEQPWFGWGGYGRNRVEDSQSAVDGLWINMVGMYGIIGLASFYAWWCWPLRLTMHIGRYLDNDPVLPVLVISVILVAINFLFNNFLDPPLIVLAGSASTNLLNMRGQRAPALRTQPAHFPKGFAAPAAP